MRRLLVSWMLVGGAAVAACGGRQKVFSKVQIKATKVSGNIYMLEGAGGNIGASIGEDGIVIGDDRFARLAEKIQAVLKSLGITDKPVRFVINTHYHGDHTGGDGPFNKACSTGIAQDNARQRLESGGAAGKDGGARRWKKKRAKERPAAYDAVNQNGT